MLTLHKYWLKEFVKFFAIIQLIILVLFVFIDYLSRMERFLNSDITLLGAFEYVLLKVPFMFMQLTPASILLASIVVFGLMNKNNELLAIRSSGISVYLLVKPAIIAGVVLAGLMFFLGETIIPITMARMYYIKFNIIQKNNTISSTRQDIWIKSENKLIHINFYDPIQKSVAGVTISALGEKNKLESRIDAKKGRYLNGSWIFDHVVEQNHDKDSSDYDVIVHESKSIQLSFEPDDLGDVTKKSDEMSYFELRKYVKKIESEGYDATTYKVDLNGKIAFPFICIIMVITGAATGMKSFVKENIPVGIALGIVIAFMYWIMYGFCLSLGYGTILPPILGAWVTNLFFFCLVTLYLVNSE